MKLIVPALQHTQTHTRFNCCAYTQKIVNFCKMMKARGHEVIHIGNAGSMADCSQHIDVCSKDLFESIYGNEQNYPNQNLFTWDCEGKYKAIYDKWLEIVPGCIDDLCTREHDAILCLMGLNHKYLADALKKKHIMCEAFIGYQLVWASNRVYESYAWEHYIEGTAKNAGGNLWNRAVIPNYLDPDRFQFKPDGRKDYALYMGRLNDDKGVGIAIDTTRAVGMRLKIVGQGDPMQWVRNNPHVDYEPAANMDRRKQLLSECHVLFGPSKYIEPFGTISIEAQYSGAPVIATDWGAWTETVLHGVTGYRCRTMDHFVWALKNIHTINRLDCHNHAKNNYSMDRVAQMYEDYFDQLFTCTDSPKQWYTVNQDRKHLDHLKKQHPHSQSTIDISPHRNLNKNTWEQAQEWEQSWWLDQGLKNWDEEIHKQKTYALLMGLPPDLNMGDKKILDVGCGPVSMLGRAKAGLKVGVDPIDWPVAARDAYRNAAVVLFTDKAEDFLERAQVGLYDEIWMYNCLQHTENPGKILANMARIGRVVRIFEWLDTPPNIGHPQTITESMIADAFEGWTRTIWNVGRIAFGDYNSAKYLSTCLERPVK